jgi:type IV pilus assembly protein PilC
MLLSEAMARHSKVFSRLYVSLVEAGEAAGILDEVLDRAALQLEKETKIKRRVKSAMIYPSLVLVFALLTLMGMLMFLVPIFEDIFKGLGGQLPLLTRVVLAASHFMQGSWYVLFPSLGAFVLGVRKLKRTEQGRRVWDRTKLHLPMKIGDVVLKVTLARFTRTLATMVAAGVDIIKALEITGTTSGNWVIEQALVEVRARVHEGVPIAQPMIELPIFPPMVGHMVKVGEETGELERMLQKIAEFYEDEVDAAISALTSIIEPVMMILVGALVGVIILSMYLPMFKLLSLIK